MAESSRRRRREEKHFTHSLTLAFDVPRDGREYKLNLPALSAVQGALINNLTAKTSTAMA